MILILMILVVWCLGAATTIRMRAVQDGIMSIVEEYPQVHSLLAIIPLTICLFWPFVQIAMAVFILKQFLNPEQRIKNSFCKFLKSSYSIEEELDDELQINLYAMGSITQTELDEINSYLPSKPYFNSLETAEDYFIEYIFNKRIDHISKQIKPTTEIRVNSRGKLTTHNIRRKLDAQYNAHIISSPRRSSSNSDDAIQDV